MAKKILIIEDEQYIAEMYKIKFRQQGFKTLVATDGETGLKLAQKQLPDLILLDLILPKLDGYQLLRQLRKDPNTQKLKVYILSNLGQAEEINKSFKVGADGYFIKANLTPTQLVGKIKKIFAQKVSPAEPTVLTVKQEKEKAIKPKLRAKILLIEDEEAIINMYQLRLNQANFQVEVARNGAWGLKLAGQKPFDAIIMDMVMPAMNGYQAIEKLKADAKTKNIPLIVISNSAQDRDIKLAKKYGAACYLLKSQITPTALVKEIEKLIKK